jgi:hypothetical protein
MGKQRKYNPVKNLLSYITLKPRRRKCAKQPGKQDADLESNKENVAPVCVLNFIDLFEYGKPLPFKGEIGHTPVSFDIDAEKISIDTQSVNEPMASPAASRPSSQSAMDIDPPLFDEEPSKSADLEGQPSSLNPSTPEADGEIDDSDDEVAAPPPKRGTFDFAPALGDIEAACNDIRTFCGHLAKISTKPIKTLASTRSLSAT